MFSKKMEYGYIILNNLKLTDEHSLKSGKKILENTKIPYQMGLGILTELSNAKIIKSLKGKNGGFYLLKKEIVFLDLFIALEATQKNINKLLINTDSEDEIYKKKMYKISEIIIKELARQKI